MNKEDEDFYIVFGFGLIAQIIVYLLYWSSGKFTYLFSYSLYCVFAVICYSVGKTIKKYGKKKEKKK